MYLLNEGNMGSNKCTLDFYDGQLEIILSPTEFLCQRKITCIPRKTIILRSIGRNVIALSRIYKARKFGNDWVFDSRLSYTYQKAQDFTDKSDKDTYGGQIVNSILFPAEVVSEATFSFTKVPKTLALRV